MRGKTEIFLDLTRQLVGEGHPTDWGCVDFVAEGK
jgi:hypothetical protein